MAAVAAWGNDGLAPCAVTAFAGEYTVHATARGGPTGARPAALPPQCGVERSPGLTLVEENRRKTKGASMPSRPAKLPYHPIG